MNAISYLEGKTLDEITNGTTGSDGRDYAFDLSAYLEKKEKEFEPGTLLCVRMIRLDSENLFSYPYIYKILRTSIDEREAIIREAIQNTKRRYVEITGYGIGAFVFDKWTNTFKKSPECYWNSLAYIHTDVPFSAAAGAWYAISPEHKAINFGLKRASYMMSKDDSLDTALRNFKERYVYECEKRVPTPKHGIPQLECYSKSPRIRFNGDQKWFSIIRCEVTLLSAFANSEYVKQNKKAIFQDLAERIQYEPRFIKSCIPINFFKIGSATLTQDGTLLVTFLLKIETEDDIEETPTKKPSVIPKEVLTAF